MTPPTTIPTTIPFLIWRAGTPVGDKLTSIPVWEKDEAAGGMVDTGVAPEREDIFMHGVCLVFLMHSALPAVVTGNVEAFSPAI